MYAGSKEIYNYFNDFSHKYGLRRYCKTGHKVDGAVWNQEKGGYDVSILDVKSGQNIVDHCDILINASGILNAWRWPAIPGLDKYKGPILHTANWDDSIDLKGKHVGLIGNGWVVNLPSSTFTDNTSSSGIQVLPTIQPHVNKVTTFIREPTWVSPVQGLEQHIFSEQERRDFANKPGALLEYRKGIETGLNGQFGLFLQNTTVQNDTRNYMLDQMKQKLNNKFLEEKLIPDWALGCKYFISPISSPSTLTRLSQADDSLQELAILKVLVNQMSRLSMAKFSRSLRKVAYATTAKNILSMS